MGERRAKPAGVAFAMRRHARALCSHLLVLLLGCWVLGKWCLSFCLLPADMGASLLGIHGNRNVGQGWEEQVVSVNAKALQNHLRLGRCG